MAEIRVEREPKRRLGWVWLVVILLLLAVAWYLWANGIIGAKTTTTPDSTRTGAVVPTAARVAMHGVALPPLAPPA